MRSRMMQMRDEIKKRERERVDHERTYIYMYTHIFVQPDRRTWSFSIRLPNTDDRWTRPMSIYSWLSSDLGGVRVLSFQPR